MIGDKYKEYHFELKHLLTVFMVIISFQLLLSFINKSSVRDLLQSTQEWYQKDSAERLANLTTTSLELLLETVKPKAGDNEEDLNRLIQSFDIIFSQQVLQNNIGELCVILKKGNNLYAVDDGKSFFKFLTNDNFVPTSMKNHKYAIDLYRDISKNIKSDEQIRSIITEKKTIHTYVPFVLRGEFIGVVYMKNTPDFSFITNQIISNYDETSIIYLSLILLGLLSMFFISSYTVKERDDAQVKLMEEHETNLKKQIAYEKELMFTNRIYHTHHKAEKIMGFIKEDLRLLAAENISDIKYRVTKYSNFVSRVIYDMKWYDPPIQTIRSQIFNVDINEVVKFIVDNIFFRISSRGNSFGIKMDFDYKLPKVHVNEFVIWELIEPLIQNSIEHGGENNLTVTVNTKFVPEEKKAIIIIKDNGKGILPELLEYDAVGVKRIFLENVSSKKSESQNVGYGCYIANEIARRCGWELDADNNAEGGARFVITLKV
jgi:anti-sigma regulatory factor (Ser/Thr protein kinase)